MTGSSFLLWNAIDREFRKNLARNICNIYAKLILNWKKSESLISRVDENENNSDIVFVVESI
jgi:hypothetical protein